MILRRLLLPTLYAGTLAIAACGGGSAPEGGIGGSGAEGTLRMSITDAPACGYDAVNITVQEVRVNQDANAGDDAAGWVSLPVSPPQRIDLLTLTNGTLLALGQTPLATGTYTQLRLVLAANDAAHPLANSVVPTGGTEVPLTTPSAQQSGLKANADITVAENQLADFVIDFDACRSVVRAGHSGKYLLKPVIEVVPNFVSGIDGWVAPAAAQAGALVQAEQGGVVVKGTVADATGHFLLEPMAPGTYDVVVTAPARANSIVTGVVVTEAQVSPLNAQATAIDPPASGTGTAQGTVTTPDQPIEAEVAALQALPGGVSVTIAFDSADAESGAYALELSVAAPELAPYVAGLPPVFVAVPEAAGVYTLAATWDGTTKTAGPLTLLADQVVTTDFAFP